MEHVLNQYLVDLVGQRRVPKGGLKWTTGLSQATSKEGLDLAWADTGLRAIRELGGWTANLKPAELPMTQPGGTETTSLQPGDAKCAFPSCSFPVLPRGSSPAGLQAVKK